MTLPLLLLLAAAPVPQTWTFQTDGTPEVRVSNIEGEILIEGVDGNTVLFEVLQEGGETARREFPVEVIQDGQVVRAQVCCGPCADKLRSCNEVAKTRFRVKVPRGAELNLSSVNSAVKVSSVRGSFNGQTAVLGGVWQ